MSEEESKGWSLKVVMLLVMLLIAWFGWAVAAAQYAQAVEGWQAVPAPPEGLRPGGYRVSRVRALAAMVVGLGSFVANSVRQVPDLPAVIGFTFRERLGLVWIFAGLELAALLGGLWMMRLERELYGAPTRVREPVHEAARRKKKRKRKPPP
jgi:hypothetical protein